MKRGILMKKQLKELQQWLKDHKVDVAFVNAPETIGYFTGYESDPHERILALLVFPESDPFLFNPALEIDDAKIANGIMMFLAI